MTRDYRTIGRIPFLTHLVHQLTLLNCLKDILQFFRLFLYRNVFWRSKSRSLSSGFAGAVTYKRCPVYAQEGCSAVLVIIVFLINSLHHRLKLHREQQLFISSCFIALNNPSTRPSVSFKTTLPTNPSQIATSHTALKMSLPSMLPMKFKLLSLFRNSRAFLTISFPLASSEPMLIIPTLGFSIFRTC